MSCAFLPRRVAAFLQEHCQRQKWRSGGVAEWLKAADCKSARVAYVGSNPTPTTIVGKRGVIKGDTLLFRCESKMGHVDDNAGLSLCKKGEKHMSKEKFDGSKPHVNIK